ncbi:MAG: hypothetical protein JST68_13865 [Bacteroidetes bacterium]|nr:hypothetical protein [Bacteroidota bacterium]
MWLTNLNTPGDPRTRSIRLSPCNPAGIAPEPALSLDGALAFPGLINSHDHLDFNLFPSLANTRYTNYRDWGWDIHSQNTREIESVLKIPLPLRIKWGIYKNLFNGFTTVINHGEHLDTEGAPINVFQNCHNLHSIGFERNWRWRLNRPSKNEWPYVIHVGEGTDPLAQREINQLLRWNLFHRPLIGVHGVAMTEEQARGFKALVWCPASNYFLLNKTAPIDQLKTQVPILFGTDSTLTAPWDAWSQIRLARQQNTATDEELFEMLTVNPATAWELPNYDTIIAQPKERSNSWDAFYTIGPDDILLILKKGEIKLFDASLKPALKQAGFDTSAFYQAGPNGKYVPDDITTLMEQIRAWHPNVRFPNLPKSYTKG